MSLFNGTTNIVDGTTISDTFKVGRRMQAKSDTATKSVYISAYDHDQEDGKTDLNPTRLVSRQRSGLISTHPYWRALCAAIEPEIRPLFEEMAQAEGASRKEGAELRNRFDVIHALGHLLYLVRMRVCIVCNYIAATFYHHSSLSTHPRYVTKGGN